ncbi:hypothetical protein [Geopseudomonas aromaticivorans]
MPTVIPLRSDAQIQALGHARVVEVGTEFVYLDKDGVRYCFPTQTPGIFLKGSIDCSRLRVFRDNSLTHCVKKTG